MTNEPYQEPAHNVHETQHAIDWVQFWETHDNDKPLPPDEHDGDFPTARHEPQPEDVIYGKLLAIVKRASLLGVALAALVVALWLLTVLPTVITYAIQSNNTRLFWVTALISLTMALIALASFIIFLVPVTGGMVALFMRLLQWMRPDKL